MAEKQYEYNPILDLGNGPIHITEHPFRHRDNAEKALRKRVGEFLGGMSGRPASEEEMRENLWQIGKIRKVEVPETESVG
jgi:hypothetical protein